jgi:RNase P subunit RPR2
MLPKRMQEKEFCDKCHKEMEISNSFLREDNGGVEVWHTCKCGYKIGFVYYGKFIDAYKNIVKSSEESATVSGQYKDDCVGTDGEKL